MKLTKVFAALVFLGVTANASYAQVSADHDVTIVVPEFNLISVSGNVSLTLGPPASPGGDPSPDVDGSSQYLVTTNATGKKITAALDAAYSAGVTLEAELGVVAGATSAGQVALTTTAQDVLTGVGLVSDIGSITYTASATAAAGVINEVRTVTYTLTN